MKFVIASHNKNKIRELKAILEKIGLESVTEEEIGINIDVEETGDTFSENAWLKASAVTRATGYAAIADDSGIAVEALDGRPGVYSARYGNLDSDEARVNKLLGEMDGKKNRNAKFVSSICCTFPNGDRVCAEGECLGVLTEKPIGCNGFGYDPIFLIPSEGLTMAELDSSRKNEISHRAKALKKFSTELEKYNADK